MAHIDVGGKALTLNEEGFLTDPQSWDHDVALALAKAEEGLDELKSLCTTRVTVKGQSVLHNVPEPRESVQRLLDAAHVTLPKTIADRGVHVSTRKKLVAQRKPRDNKRLAATNSQAK